MPPNPLTGKTDRRPHTEEKLLAFRIDQALKMVVAAEGKESLSEVKKGKRKRRVRDSPEAGDSEISEGPGQSLPAAKNSGLENLLLKNVSGSSPAGTPADSPAPWSQPPSAHSTHGVSKSPAGKSVSTPFFSSRVPLSIWQACQAPRRALPSTPQWVSVFKAPLSAPARYSFDRRHE
jgi:hypothetical protein